LYSVKSLVKYAINNVTAFSAAPLTIIPVMGMIFLVCSFILIVQTLTKWAMGHAVEGFTTVIILLLVIGGVLMISLGVIGYYIAKIYDEIKERPRYIVSERV
jgi:dolichol-phosphate mannosyltransferase